jgi:hypothetical protein
MGETQLLNREQLIEQAGKIHARECSCDPKYVMSCPNMANIILRFGGKLIFRCFQREENQPLVFTCGICLETVSSDLEFERHAREHGKNKYFTVLMTEVKEGGTE